MAFCYFPWGSKSRRSSKFRSLIDKHDKDGIYKQLAKNKWHLDDYFHTDSYPPEWLKITQLKTDLGSVAAIHYVIIVGWEEGLRLLVEAAADINKSGTIIRDIKACTRYLKGEVIRLTEVERRFLKWVDFTPVMLAVQYEQTAMLEFLLESDADPFITCNRSHDSAIGIAIETGNEAATKALLKRHRFLANTKVWGERGELMPLQLAWTHKWKHPHGTVLKHVIKASDDVNQVLETKEDPNHPEWHQFLLLHAVLSEFPIEDPIYHEFLTCLYERGADVEAVFQVYTALSKLITTSNVRYLSRGVRWLIRHGANTSVLMTKEDRSRTGIAVSVLHRVLSTQNPDFKTAAVLIKAGVHVTPGDIAIIEGEYRKMTNVYVPVIRYWKQPPPTHHEYFWLKKSLKYKTKGQTGEPKAADLTYTRVEWREKQAKDLLEFSDESLEVYNELGGHDTIVELLNFLSNPPPLKWKCRQMLRQNLLSLSPCLIKVLPVPAAAKRYILCHEL